MKMQTGIVSRRRRKIGVRVSDDEYEVIRRKAARRMVTPATLLRMLAATAEDGEGQNENA